MRIGSVLDRKVLRDLVRLRSQVLTIALLVAAGVAVFVMSASDYRMLERAQASHYAQERFAEVFASLKRAPRPVADRLRAIEGVAALEARIVASVRLDRADQVLPISGRMVSIPDDGQPLLHRLAVVEGGWVDPTRRDEVLVNEAFARAHGLRPGHALRVILNGRLQSFRIVGIALSPEFVFASRAGEPLPDDRNFVVLWAAEDAVASAFDMFGAFNDVVLTLAPGASGAAVIAEVDRILASYGGTGAYGRRDHPSHRFLEDELVEQRTLALISPAIFFGVAAFLLAIVVGRLVEAQREQIAALKALGYPTGPILRHYLAFVGVIAVSGALLGVLVGDGLARLMVEAYRPFFHFPAMSHRLEAWIPAAALAGSLAAALGAVIRAVRRVVLLPAALAMRPAAPPRLGRGLRHVDGRWMSPRRLVAWRGALARPLRTLVSILGVSLAVPLVVLGLFWFDALAYMIDLSFERIERGDAVLSLVRPVPDAALASLRGEEGVILAEGLRVVPARLRAGHRSYRTAVSGLPAASQLRVPRERDLTPVAVPAEGLLVSRRLAARLGVRVGDSVALEVLEGARPERDVTVTAVADDVLGLTATMEAGALNRLMREGPVVNAVALRIDPSRREALWRRLAGMPAIETTSMKSLWLELFEQRIVGLIRISAAVLIAFGFLIAGGIVYNNARITFQERAWEMASLRILGFTRAEVFRILFAELVAVMALAVPLGLVLARWLVEALLAARGAESFDIPAVIAPSTYALAALVVAGAGLASALEIRRRLERLDLVAALKTRE